MFYSHEILTSRKHGVATIWLVATLGSKSGLKRVTRKAILDVDVSKACTTIVDPQEPMALRLQGNLLFGVSRVYAQQCGYVLSDTQAARDKLRQAISWADNKGLDPDAGHARPNQINVPEDLSLVPDFTFNFDLSILEGPEVRHSSLLSIPSLNNSTPNQRIPALDLDSVGTSGIGDGGFGYGPESSSVQGPKAKGGYLSLLDDEHDFLDSSLLMDEDGNVLDVLSHDMAHDNGQDRTTAGSMVSSSGRDLSRVAADAMDISSEIPIFGDDDQLPARHSSPLPGPSTAGLSEHPPIQDVANTATTAPQQRRRGPRILEMDYRQELTSEVLKEWNEFYVLNMREARDAKLSHKSISKAKKHAAYFVYGHGIGGVGIGLGRDKIPGALNQFCGEELLLTVLGERGHKRTRSKSTDSNEKRVRARSGLTEPDQNEVVMDDYHNGTIPGAMTDNLGDDEGILGIGDDDVEIGREAPSSLPEHRSSMPWHISGSRQGSNRFGSAVLGASSSQVGRGGMDIQSLPSFHRRDSRLTSISPLVGRGLSLGRLSQLEIPGHDQSSFPDENFISGLRSPSVVSGEFPRRLVDSQAVAMALDYESENFFYFVAAHIHATNEGREDAEEDGGEKDMTTFAQLLPPTLHTKDVATQGLLHILTLATRGLIDVHYEKDVGEIYIKLIKDT